MTNKQKNYSNLDIGPFTNLLERNYNGAKGKFFIGKELGLTGCEVSLNRIPAGKGTPFVHSHKKNEEVYIITGGKGVFFVDGNEFPVQEGSLIRVAPDGERAWKAGDADLYFICIQAEVGSLTQATREDGRISETKTGWM